MSLTLPIANGTRLYGAYLLGKKDFKRSSLYGMVSNLVPAILLVLALIFTKNIWVIIAVYFLSLAILSSIFFKRVLRVYNIRERNKADSSLFSYGGHLSFMDILGRVAGSLDKILIFHYLGAAPLAIFSFAIAPVEQLQGGKKILSTLVLPKLSERPFQNLQRSVPKKALVLVVYALILALVWVIAAPYFYKFFYPQYLDSIPYSQIYSLTLLAIGGTLFQETLVAHQKTKELYFHRTIVPIIQLFLFFIIIPFYGILGLITVHVIIRTLSGLVAFYLIKHPFKTPLS